MGIYSPITITEEIEQYYKPTRLYVKEPNGIKYFGKTILQDIYKYSGSGTRWVNHVAKYGKKNIKTLWVSDWFICPHHLQDFALTFSELNDIVGSDIWANLTAENGLSGGHFNLAAKTLEERTEIQRRASVSRLNRTLEQKKQRSIQHTKSLTENWSNRSEEEKLAHAINTSKGLTQMWKEMSDNERAIRKQREMATKNAKSLEERAKISSKQKESRHRLFHRTNVLALKELANRVGVKLGGNWRAKSDEWVNYKLQELTEQ